MCGFVYLVRVGLCKSVWAQSVDTFITPPLSSETGAGAAAVMCPLDCCFTRDPEIVKNVHL